MRGNSAVLSHERSMVAANNDIVIQDDSLLLLLEADNDGGCDDDVPKDVRIKKRLAKQMERTHFSSDGQEKNNEIFPYDEDGEEQDKSDLKDIGCDDDEQSSFVLVCQQKTKTNSAISTKTIDNINRLSTTKGPFQRLENESNKENDGDNLPGVAGSLQQCVKLFPRPPPPSTTTNANGPLYCSRILKSHLIDNACKNKISVTEFTCDCCQPRLSDESEDVDDNTPTAIVIDFDDEDGENEDLAAAVVEVDSQNDSFVKLTSPKSKIGRENEDHDDDGDSSTCSTITEIMEQVDGNHQPISDYKASSVASPHKVPAELALPSKISASQQHLTSKDTQEKEKSQNIASRPENHHQSHDVVVDLMDTSESDSDHSWDDGLGNNIGVDKGIHRRNNGAAVGNTSSNTTSTSSAKPLRFRKVNIAPEKKPSRLRTNLAIESSSSSSDDDGAPSRNLSQRQRPGMTSRKARRPKIDSSSDEEYHEKPILSDDINGNLADLMKRVDIKDDNKKTKKSQRKPRTSSLSDDSFLVADDESSYIEIGDDDDDDDDSYSSEVSAAAKSKRARASKNSPPQIATFGKRPIDAPPLSRKAFQQKRTTLAAEAFANLDRDAFDGKLSAVEVTWSNKLQTTAGVTRLITVSRGKTVQRREAAIELATKIIDDLDRLRATLLHEMCHAAAWLIDGVAKPAHGACFKKWSRIAMEKVPGVVVTLKHDYEIAYKYAWACTAPTCTAVIKRHSRSVDVNRKCCGRCKGKLIEIEVPKPGDNTSNKQKPANHQPKADLTPKKKAPLSAYQIFIKENSRDVRETFNRERQAQGIFAKVTQGEVMKECARLWKEQKSFL